jgi:hypothetical protein
MVNISSDPYTGSDHETLCREIDKVDSHEINKVATTGWKIRQPINNDDINEEEK